MRKRPQQFSLMAAIIALTTAMVALVGPSARAATAPNGLIAYSSWDDDLNYDIYVVDPATPDVPPVRLTTDGRYNANPDWSPDGSKIAYDGWAAFSGPRIQVMDTDPATDFSRVLTQPCAPGEGCYGDFQPSWSPDGTKIAFVSSRPSADGTENWSYQLYVMDAVGEFGGQVAAVPATRLTNDPAPEDGSSIQNSQVTWSPDGKRIAFLSTGRGDDADTCDLWAMDAQDLDGDGFGDNLQRLTFDESSNCDAFEDVGLQWSPNSSLIAFTSTRSGYFDIWLVNADDPTDLRNVTQTPIKYEDQPNWSPDGTQIIFRGTADGAYEFFSLPVPPAGPAGAARRVAPPRTQLTFDGTQKQQPDWGATAGSLPSTVTLDVKKVAQGLVTSSPAGIVCGRDCSSTFVKKSVVRLRAVARPGFRFAGWRGFCSGTEPTCRLHMNASKFARPRFVAE